MKEIDIVGAVFGDTSFIAYRPDLRKITPSITSAILLQQVVHRWIKNKKEKFYKFREPCKHEKYREGDSWTEELGFSEKEFDSALRSIGFKLGKTKNSIEKKDALIVYYRDGEGLTWYSLNEELLSSCLLGNYQGVAERETTKVVAERETTNTSTEITRDNSKDTDTPFSSYEESTRMNKKPRSPREFANARRAELGKPPLHQPPRTEKQDLAVKALKLIDLFKKTFYEKHGEGVDTYFGGDSEENGKYIKLAKACVLLLGEDSEQYVRDWIGGLGEFFQYDPSNCWSESQMKKWKVSKKIKQNENIIKPEYL